MTPSTLKANPGGILDVQDIVGREREIAHYWRILQRQSLVLSAERRIGKTHIVRKMHAEERDGFVTIYQDLERVHSVMEFVRVIYRAVAEHVKTSRRAKHLLVRAWDDLAKAKVADTELPDAGARWKGFVEGAIRDTLESVDGGQKVVFFWDEFPLMLDNLRKRGKPDDAIELLDLLRALRVEFPARLRFVFTGSIGLHLVLRELRRSGNTNAPTNDMQHEVVPAMALEEATELAQRLLLGLPFPPSAARPLAEELVRLVEGFPYYIHHTADQLAQLDHHPSPEDVRAAVSQWIRADQDPANLRYYEERIATYYGADERRVGRSILTALAKLDEPQTLDQLVNLALHARAEDDVEFVEEVVALLRQDHYLTLDVSDRYLFRWGVVKRWWRATHR